MWGRISLVGVGSRHFNGKNGNLYKLAESDGSSVWTTYMGVQPTVQGNIASPAVANGIVFAGAMDNNPNIVDDITGNLLWKQNIGLIYSSPIVVNGWLYCGSTDGKLYAFSL
jgi:outer membrane protein assembly factor BamB